MDEFYLQKGAEHALAHIGDSLDSLVSGIAHWLYDGWGHSYPAGHCHHHVSGPSYSGKKILQLFGPLPEQVKYLEKRMVNRSRKILPKLAMLSGEKVS